MQIMTRIGPTNYTDLVQALREDIQLTDGGIDLLTIETEWGVTLIPTRQGKKLSWRITMNKQGQSGIYKPLTATIPQVQLSFEKNEHLKLRDHFIHFIERGWV